MRLPQAVLGISLITGDKGNAPSFQGTFLDLPGSEGLKKEELASPLEALIGDAAYPQ